MKSFNLHQRVRLVDPCIQCSGMQGRTGTVIRLRHSDNGAWVQMDRNLPANISVFESGDDRHRHVLLFPEECKPITPATRM